MNAAIQHLHTLTADYNDIGNTFYNKEKTIRNYNDCINLCKRDLSYKLCTYNQMSSKYAIATIKIYMPECSEIPNYTDIIKFQHYIENGSIKKLPYDWVGVIPNYVYIIGDNGLFQNKHSDQLQNDNCYLIELQIPFTLDEELSVPVRPTLKLR